MSHELYTVWTKQKVIHFHRWSWRLEGLKLRQNKNVENRMNGTEQNGTNEWIEWMNGTTDDDDSNLLTLFRNQFIHHKNIWMWITLNEIIYLWDNNPTSPCLGSATHTPLSHSLSKSVFHFFLLRNHLFYCCSFCFSNP